MLGNWLPVDSDSCLCFTNKSLKFMANSAPLLTNVCQSRNCDLGTGLVKVVAWETEDMALGRKCHDSFINKQQ
jgi:hypothetical protein